MPDNPPQPVIEKAKVWNDSGKSAWSFPEPYQTLSGRSS